MGSNPIFDLHRNSSVDRTTAKCAGSIPAPVIDRITQLVEYYTFNVGHGLKIHFQQDGHL